MKFILRYTLLVAVILGANLSLSAQKSASKIQTAEFEVAGVCKMCKKRIENSAIIKGVKFAEWEQDTHTLKVIFNEEKTSKETIKNAVAEAGHDIADVKGDDKAYSKLPDCCKYRDGVKDH